MKSPESRILRPTRRRVVGAAAGLAAATAGLGAVPGGAGARHAATGCEPFWGEHQGGIATLAQGHSYFAAFDLLAAKRDELIRLLRAWTEAAARMAAGRYATPSGQDAAPDSGETLGMAPAGLSLTFGFGAGVFVKDGKDRFGLAARRPAALVDLPRFNGDQLIPARSGGDLSVQACANDPQAAFHAVRQLARLAYGVAAIRWVQTGFVGGFPKHETPRNLIGFKDGTGNPSSDDLQAMAEFVWVGDEGPPWVRGGSYVVVRRIRIALEHWDRMSVAFQEAAIGRRKSSGAPLGGINEFDRLDLAATDRDGNPIIPESAHVRLAAAATNGGARILRRVYSYNDGFDFITERWPPWRQGFEYDVGLFFVCYQRDPRTGFIRIFDKLARFDMLNQFVTHTGGGLFACPGGVREGEFIGQGLFETA
jgi:deferrochelatase/peroxidase EfeB